MRLVKAMSFVAIAGLGLSLLLAAKEKEKFKLGRQTIGGYNISVIMLGDIHEEKAVEFDAKIFDAKDEPKKLTIWLGVESGEGSEKVELKKKEKTYGATAPVPSPLPKDTRVWLEVESASGKAKGSYEIKEDHHHH